MIVAMTCTMERRVVRAAATHAAITVRLDIEDMGFWAIRADATDWHPYPQVGYSCSAGSYEHSIDAPGYYPKWPAVCSTDRQGITVGPTHET